MSKVIGIKWTLRGSENLSKDRTYIIVANHQSSLDVQGMMGKREGESNDIIRY